MNKIDHDVQKYLAIRSKSISSSRTCRRISSCTNKEKILPRFSLNDRDKYFVIDNGVKNNRMIGIYQAVDPTPPFNLLCLQLEKAVFEDRLSSQEALTGCKGKITV